VSQPQFVSVPPGTYSVTETDPAPAYDLDNIFCEDSVTGGTASITDVGSRTAIINLDPGETVSCAFDNFARGSLSVTKQVTEDGPSVNDFGFSSGALGAFSLLDVTTATPRTQQFADLATGDYDLAEVDPSANDWVLDSATCSDGTDLLLTGTVFLDVGGDITCTFVNSPLELPPPPPPPAPQIPIPVDGTLALALLVLCMLWIGMTSLRNGRGRSG
jgi:hypothetical protein